MKGHLTSFFWTLDKKATPWIKIVRDNGLEKYYPLKRNTEIRVIKDFGKKCTGYYKNGKKYECPSNEIIKYGTQCKKCRQEHDYLNCAKCNGSKCTASTKLRETCFKKTHFLYLTIIGDKIKVGVTRAGRYLKRWIEQGSDYSCIISSGTGMEVRRKESILSKEITDRLKTTQKIKLFMKDNKDLFQEFLQHKKLNVPIINVRKYYEGLDKIPKKPCIYDGLLNGRIVCVKGKIIVFEKKEEYYYYNMNDLIAHEVEIELKS